MAGSLIKEDSVHFIGQASGFAVGANLVTNGDFADDSVWDAGDGWVIAGGNVTYSGTTNSNLSQSSVLISNKVHRLTYTVVSSTINGELKFSGLTTADQETLDKTVGTHTKTFTSDGSPGTTFALRITSNTGGTITIDNVEIVEWVGDPDAGGGCTIASFTGTMLDYMGVAGQVLHHDTGLALSDDGGSLAIASGGSWDKTPIVGTLVKCDFSGTYTDGIYAITAASAGSITIDLAAGTPAGETVEVWIGGAFPDIESALNDSTLSEDPDGTYRKRYICVNVPMEVDAVTDFVAETSETALREDDGSRKLIGFYDSISVVNLGAGGGSYGYRVVSDMDYGQTYYAGARKAFNQEESFPVINPNGKWIEWNAKGNDFGATGIIVMDTSNLEFRNLKIHNTIADAGTEGLIHIDTANANITFTNCWFDTSSLWQVNDLISTHNNISDCFFGDGLGQVILTDWQRSVFINCIFSGASRNVNIWNSTDIFFSDCLIYKGSTGVILNAITSFTNNIFFDQTTTCIFGDGATQGLGLYSNNIFSPVAASDIAIDIDNGSFSPAGFNNIMYSVTGGGILTNPITHDQITPNPPLPAGTLEVDPLFVNPAQGDFRLQHGSPARNAGIKDIFDGKSTIGIWDAISGDILKPINMNGGMGN